MKIALLYFLCIPIITFSMERTLKDVRNPKMTRQLFQWYLKAANISEKVDMLSSLRGRKDQLTDEEQQILRERQESLEATCSEEKLSIKVDPKYSRYGKSLMELAALYYVIPPIDPKHRNVILTIGTNILLSYPSYGPFIKGLFESMSITTGEKSTVGNTIRIWEGKFTLESPEDVVRVKTIEEFYKNLQKLSE